MGISFTTSGSYAKTFGFLHSITERRIFSVMDRYGPVGVAALAAATPKDSGVTAQSWDYTISEKNGVHAIEWHNSHIVGGVNVAILIQYGHGTGTGGYVQGHDYINPVTKTIFDQILADIQKEVSQA